VFSVVSALKKYIFGVANFFSTQRYRVTEVHREECFSNFSQRKPTTIAMKEAMSTEIFAISCCDGSVKASVEIKMLMVKPIPHNNPAPVILCQLTPLGNSANFFLQGNNRRHRCPKVFRGKDQKEFPS
jgi:hypothetical protein